MRNRLIVLAVALVFAASVASLAVIAADDGPKLEKLPVAATGAGGDEVSTRSASQAGDAATSLLAALNVEYRVTGKLTEPTGPAPAFRLAATATKAQVAELAAILGVDGTVQETGERFVVRSGDRELTVEKVAGLPWYLGVACGDTVGPDSPVGSDGVMSKCAVASVVRADAVAVAVDGGGSTGSVGSGSVAPAAPVVVPPASETCVGGLNGCPSPAPPPPSCPPGAECVEPAFPVCADDVKCAEPVPLPEPVRPADLPTRAAAEARARTLFTKLGSGLDRFEISDGFDAWYANVQPRIAGLPTTDRYTSVAIGAKGTITYANGFLAVPERLGDYPLAGTAVGLERLKAFSFPAVDQPLALGAPEIADCSSATVICDAPSGGKLDPQSPRLPETQVVNLIGVHLALQQLDDRLVPVYVFEIEGGGETFGVPAVVDELLHKPAR